MKTDLLDQIDAPAPAEDVALAPVSPSVSMFERLATDPNVDVAKLERLIAMQERILGRNAEAAFNAAFAEMQAEIPEIDEKGHIKNKDGDVQSKYARNEDIQKALRPILQKHGFSLSFQTEWPDKNTIKLIGILTHRDGHARRSEFLAAADTSGSKNAIQALGSSISYGHRYTSIDLLNITSRGQDDDGQRAVRPEPPAGFDDWLSDMNSVADEGLPKLEAVWKASKREYREYISKHDGPTWARLKKRAGGVQ